jgi:uncharacterized protein (TIGR00297 family)
MMSSLWAQALFANALLIAASLKLRLLSRSGNAAGFIIGVLIYGSLGWQGWAVLLAFFLGGTVATKFRFSDKQRMGVAQDGHGRRRWRHAWANAGAGVACALASWACAREGLPQYAEAFRWAFVGAFAAALSDTLSSEFGQLAGKEPRLITTGEVVSPGTDGGITLAGTLMGILGAAVLSLLARVIDLTPVRATLPLLLAGLAGNLLDSWLGATFERSGRLNNEGVNFINTLGGAALGYGGFWLMSLIPSGLRSWGWDTIAEFFI